MADGRSTVYAGGDTVEDPYGQPLGGYHDAELKESFFKLPWAVAPFLDGWAVSDAENDAVRIIRPEVIQTLNGHSEERLTVSKLGVEFHRPTGLAADNRGNLYVSDTLQGAIRKITSRGEVTTVATGLSEPMGLCWKDGDLYVAESGANRVLKISKTGNRAVLAGNGNPGFVNGTGGQASFSSPQGVAVDKDGTVYVSDTTNSAIRRIQNGRVTTLIARDITNLRSFFPIAPAGLLVQGDTLYICDTFARKLLAFPLR